ncbi:MAG: SDR family oxidoreductase [Pseudomonadota bacterium]
MSYGLQGKTAFLTGGSSGITLGIAEKLAEEGANLTILARKEEKLTAARDQLEALGAECLAIPADVRDAEAMAEAMRVTAERFGAVDIVIAGAAGNFLAPAKDLSPKGFRTVMEIDAQGVFNTFHSAYPHLTKPGACLIAISAPQATIPYPAQIHANAAKAAIDHMVRTLAVEWGPEGVRCLGISPGPIADTEGMRRLAPTPEATERAAAQTPLKRLGLKTEVAELAAFLASDRASYITGAIIPCDGGLALAGARGLG